MYFNGTKCQLFIFSCFLSLSALAKDVKTLNAGGLQKPLCFVENKGQVLDDQAHSRSDIQFKLAGKGVSLFVGNGQLHYQFKDVIANPKQPQISTYRMDVTLLGANPSAKVTASDKLDYYENYYIPQVGPDGVSVNAYSKIVYTDVYPNIDWVLYVKDGNVEYDFVVRPGGDPKNIKLQYGGATDLSITADGSIKAVTPMGSISEKHPVAYETKTGKHVDSRFALNNNVVSFVTDKYNGSLTIDPYLQWSTYFGGTNEDVVTSVKCSAGGNTYATGYTASAGLSFGGAVYQTTNGGGTYDAFLVRYSAAGAMSFATYFGGNGNDMGMSVAVDYPGTGIFIAGSTTTSTGLGSGTAYQATNAGGTDIFLAKFGTTGARTWSTYLGGSGDDIAYSVICDSTAISNVYVGGSTQSADIASTDGTVLNGAKDGIIAKFTNAGTNAWVSYLGGDGDDEIRALAVNNNSFIVAAGQTNSSVGIATAGAYQTTLSGTNDAFVSYIKTPGFSPLTLWSTYVGGTGTEIGSGLASDFAHNIFLTGTTSSADGISSGLSYPNAAGGLNDAFLMKMDATGTVKWGTYFGGTANDNGAGVCTDAFGNITITGGTASTGLASVGAYQTALSGVSDAYVAKYNTYGQKIYSTYFGKTGNDFANSIIAEPSALGTASAIIIGGSTNSTTTFTSVGSAQATYGGGVSDGFVTKFYRDTIVGFRQLYADTVLCPGTTFTVHDTVNYNFGAGNIFKVQLSDATGSFAAPVQIGTVTSSASGAIACTIPIATTAGTGYRIRIVSTNPVTTSVDNNININIVTTLPVTTPTANTPLCVGMTLNLSDIAPYSVSSYSWAGPASFSAGIQSPSIPAVTAANAGTYTVTVTHTNNCPTSVATINVVVNSFIPPTPTDSASSPICAGSTLSLFANSNYPGTFSYHWSGPGGFTSTLQNPTIPGIAAADTGFYYVIDTLNGCPSAKDSIHVSITPTDSPNVVISVSPADTVCWGTTLHFAAVVTNGGYSPTYQWMSGPTTPIVGAIFSDYSSATIPSGTPISCIITGSVACPDKPYDTSNVITVTVLNNTPVANITASPDTFITAGATVTLHAYSTGTSIVGYVWYVNNVPVVGASSSTLVLTGITHNDTIRYEVLSNAVCANIGVSNTIVIHLNTAVGNTSPEFSNIDLFPNPNNGSFTVKGTLENVTDGVATLEVTNAIGQLVHTQLANIVNRQLEQSVKVSDMPTGIYLLRISKDGAAKTFRFMKD